MSEDPFAPGNASAPPKPAKKRSEAPKLQVAGKPEVDSYQRQLRVNAVSGRPTKDLGNLAVMFAEHPSWKGRLGWSELAFRVEWLGEPDWTCGRPLPFPPGQLHSAQHDIWAAHWLALHYGFTVNTSMVRAAIEFAAQQKPFHPVRDYLQGLRWDAVPRLATMAATYFGSDDTLAHRAAMVQWMISAVARAMMPGCKVDTMLVLESGEGQQKTMAIELLGGAASANAPSPWVHPSLPPLGRGEPKAAKEALLGIWIAVIDELNALKGAGGEASRNFLTTREDVFRPAYGKDVIRSARQCVFVGTTNKHTYHVDDRGRRYLPVTVRRIDAQALLRDRDLLWAEAFARYDSGQDWYSYGVTPEEKAEAEEALKGAQAERREIDDWASIINRELEGLDDIAGERVLQMVITDKERWTKADQARVQDIMRQSGWARKGAKWFRKETT